MAFGIGATVGDYRVIGVIGSGGMGTVYKVQHLISDRIEAMKVVPSDLAESPELAERFVREIKVQASLNHPNIASLHNALRFENQLLMVMEFVEGVTLDTYLRQQPRDLNRSIDFVVQVLHALAYAHGRGVIHRDIKPPNIMLTPAAQVKLMDFGIARATGDQQITQAGAAVGSVHYMSPEQVRGAAVDARSDLYSVGVVLYEIATGVRPITGSTSWEIMNGHMSQIPRSPHVFNPQLSPTLSLAILRALEKDPNQRFQSATEFLETLQAFQRRPLPSGGTSAATIVFQPQTPVTPAIHAPVPSSVAAPVMTPPPAAHSSPATPAGQTRVLFEPRQLDGLKKELAVYIGPMARVIVDRAAKKAASWKQLYELVAEEVPAGKDREKFLGGRS